MARGKKAKLLWVDLEMTGLDPKEDRILEVAAIITDWNFNEIATYEAAVKVSPQRIKKRMFNPPNAVFWDSIPKVRDALISASKENGRDAKTVEDELMLFIKQHFDEDYKVVLAGNSIHQDRRFIVSEWPRLDALLHYRMLDVSAWKVVLEGKYRRKFAKPEVHRALEDIKGSIEELKYYLGKAKF